MSRLVLIAAVVLLDLPAMAGAQIVINEVVTDPQQDWNDTLSGDGIPFNGVPGSAPPDTSDEWIEILNNGGATVDLTGWTLEMNDATPVTIVFGTGATYVFTSGSLTSFPPGQRVVIGDPTGTMNNDTAFQLRNGVGALVDAISLGVSGAPNGNATGLPDEAVARTPDGTDTDNDAADLSKQPATIGATNPVPVELMSFSVS